MLTGLLCRPSHHTTRCLKYVVGGGKLVERIDDLCPSGHQRVDYRNSGAHLRHVAPPGVLRENFASILTASVSYFLNASNAFLRDALSSTNLMGYKPLNMASVVLSPRSAP